MRNSKRDESGRALYRFCVLGFAICLWSPSAVAVAQRIVSLLPSDTEIVDALGAGDSIVGVTIFERPAVSGRASVGDFVNPSVEKIVALRPSLVLAGAWQNSKALPEIQRLGIPVLEIANPRSLEELYASIGEIAAAVGRTAQAPSVIAALRARLGTLQGVAPRPALRTYIEIDAPLWTIGGRDFLSEALCAVGACNIFGDLRRPASQVSSESVIERNPELIISLDASKAEVSARPGWASIRAVQRGWIIDRSAVNPDRLVRPSPRLMEGLSDVSQHITRLMKPS